MASISVWPDNGSALTALVNRYQSRPLAALLVFTDGNASDLETLTELSKRDTGNTFYILDEPTTGLHFEDIRVLMKVLNKLADKGNTVLIIEHNLDVIKTVDYIIDVGYEGGKGGGEIVAKGTPEQIVKDKKSYTAKFLKNELK